MRRRNGRCVSRPFSPESIRFYTVDFGQLHALRLRKRRQNGRDTRCHHSLARTRRSHKQQIVHSGYRNLTRPLHQPLSVYLSEKSGSTAGCVSSILYSSAAYFSHDASSRRRMTSPDIFHTADKHPGNKRRLFFDSPAAQCSAGFRVPLPPPPSGARREPAAPRRLIRSHPRSAHHPVPHAEAFPSQPAPPLQSADQTRLRICGCPPA